MGKPEKQETQITKMKLKYTTMLAMAAMACSGQAATIAWGAVTGVTSSTSIANNGTFVAAVNSAGTAQTVNGVSFAANGGGTSTFWTGEGGNSTGDTGLDAILNTHVTSYGTPTHPSAFQLDMTGLTIGQMYQIQIIGIHDLRGCCSGRTYTMPDDTGAAPAYTNGTQLARNSGGNDGGGSGSAAGTVIGTFTADSVNDFILITNTVAPGGNDPGISGYSLRAIPEPSSTALLGLGGLALILRRRK